MSELRTPCAGVRMSLEDARGYSAGCCGCCGIRKRLLVNVEAHVGTVEGEKLTRPPPRIAP